jgi:ribosomal protein L34
MYGISEAGRRDARSEGIVFPLPDDDLKWLWTATFEPRRRRGSRVDGFRKRFLVKPGAKVRLADRDPGDTAGFDDKEAVREAGGRRRESETKRK